jgi:hypothetical protein
MGNGFLSDEFPKEGWSMGNGFLRMDFLKRDYRVWIMDS